MVEYTLTMVAVIAAVPGPVALVSSLSASCTAEAGNPAARLWAAGYATHKFQESLKANIDDFILLVRYHGPEEGEDRNLALSVAPSPSPRLRLSVDLSRTNCVRITRDEAEKIVEHLAKDGFLRRGFLNRMKTLIAPHRPFFFMTVFGAGDEQYYEPLPWGLRMRERLAALRGVLDGEAAEAMDELLKPLREDPLKRRPKR